jgi:ABC-type Na+ efflux pump permease subunit
MGPEIVVPVVLFGSVVGVVWLIMFYGQKRRAEAFQTLRLAIEKGQEITPEAMAAMARMSPPNRDMRLGIIFISIALAFASMGLIIGTGEGSDMHEAIRPLLGIAVFPLFLGLAFLGLHFFANDAKRP